jgi:hypothetical protein
VTESRRLAVLADADGRILAALAPGVAGSEGAPVLEFEPGPDQVVREVEVPAEWFGEHGPDVAMLVRHRVDLSTGDRLVRVDDDR